MTRATLTQTIKALSGKITNSGKTFACYQLPVDEAYFIVFRTNIPWVNVWQTGDNSLQLFTVHFDKLV